MGRAIRQGSNEVFLLYILFLIDTFPNTPHGLPPHYGGGSGRGSSSLIDDNFHWSFQSSFDAIRTYNADFTDVEKFASREGTDTG